MKKIFTLFLSLCIYTLVMAQGKEATIAKAGDVKPVIDGVLDDVWAAVEQHDVVTPFRTEASTFGAEGTTYWKALWDDQGMYIIIVANDDVWSPWTNTNTSFSDYNFDRIEMYFDTNYILEDGVGGQAGSTGNRQIAPNPTLDKLDGETLTTVIQGGTVQYAFKVENPKWTTEWFVPWTSIPDKDGNLFDKTATMGFDVQITDNDDGQNVRNRVYWSNAGGKDECWNNMDDAGHITLDGAQPGVDISGLAISGGQTITTDNGTVQLSAVVTPADATQLYKWVIAEGAEFATVNKDGVVTAIRDGAVKVKAVSIDDFVNSNELTITISGQKTTLAEVSLIKDGDFTMGTATNQSTFWTGGRADAIEDGVYTIINPTAGANPWDYTVGQDMKIPESMKNTPFVLQFKAWAEAERIFDVDFELIGDNYDRFGDTPDPRSSDGKTQWRMTLTTEPTVYTFDINNFVRMDTRQQKFNLFAGMATPKVFIDKIVLVTKEDYDKFSGTSVKALSENAISKVYLNQNILNVDFSGIHSKVAIYNAIGQKLMEKTSTGNKVTFDVSSLRKGMYIVRLEDGSTQKFVK